MNLMSKLPYMSCQSVAVCIFLVMVSTKLVMLKIKFGLAAVDQIVLQQSDVIDALVEAVREFTAGCTQTDVFLWLNCYVPQWCIVLAQNKHSWM